MEMEWSGEYEQKHGRIVTGIAKWCGKSYIERVLVYNRHVLNIEGKR
jgi:hypothetical protein